MGFADPMMWDPTKSIKWFHCLCTAHVGGGDPPAIPGVCYLESWNSPAECF